MLMHGKPCLFPILKNRQKILKSNPIIYQVIDFFQFYRQDLGIIAVTFLPIYLESFCPLFLIVDVRKRLMM